MPQCTLVSGNPYALSASTIAIVSSADGKRVAVQIPRGAVVQVLAGPTEGNRLIEVRWDGKDCEIFTIDLQERGQAVRAAGPLPF
jgi:hypothetical protein